MIDAQRLGNLDSVLAHLAASSAPAVWSLFKSFKTSGFSAAESMLLTTTVLNAILSVPNPIEQPAH